MIVDLKLGERVKFFSGNDKGKLWIVAFHVAKSSSGDAPYEYSCMDRELNGSASSRKGGYSPTEYWTSILHTEWNNHRAVCDVRANPSQSGLQFRIKFKTGPPSRPNNQPDSAGNTP